MRIVIIGEFSGFAKNLKEGFKRLGHTPFLYTWGDSFKKISAGDDAYTIKIDNYIICRRSLKGTNRLRAIVSAWKLNRHIEKKWRNEKADAVIIINPAFIKSNNNIFSPYFSCEMIKRIVTANARIYLSACGNDFVFNSYLPLCKKTNEFAIKKYYSVVESEKKRFIGTLGILSGVIPVMADYALAYRFFKDTYNYNILPTIPLPFDVSSVKSLNVVKEKIVIMHGITRPYEKGSYIILSALEELQKKYTDKIVIRVVERAPLLEYLKIMQEANIIIDQCYSYGYGMNAIEALAMGKVVLSGNEEENMKEFCVTECPVVNIKPNAGYIYNKLEYFICNPKAIDEYSRKGRMYAEQIHDAPVVAQKYLDVFNS